MDCSTDTRQVLSLKRGRSAGTGCDSGLAAAMWPWGRAWSTVLDLLGKERVCRPWGFFPVIVLRDKSLCYLMEPLTRGLERAECTTL